jgi:5-methylcytosine-specific restriction endonuclease McrA
MCDIKISRNPVFKQLEVIILKNDGSVDNVSVMKKCITGLGGNSDNLYRAMRSSIEPQILQFKQITRHLCTSCGSNQNLEVDHKSPGFFQLVDVFSNETKLPIPTTFDDNEYHSKVFTKQDTLFKEKWNSFHLQNATLQFLCKNCHSKKPVATRKKSRKIEFHPYQKSQRTSKNKVDSCGE